MTSLEKAKRFIQKTACKTGLLIIPLAAATVTHAKPFTGPVLPSGGATCSMSDGGISGGCASGAINFSPLGAGSLAGVSLFTVSGGGAYTSGGTAELLLSASGTLLGGAIPAGTTIPLGYDFDLSFWAGDVGASISDWTLDFQLFDGATLIGDSGQINGTLDDPEVGQSFSDTAAMTTTSTALVGDYLTESVLLTVDWSPGDFDTLQIEVPQGGSSPGSFDYDSTDIASVPEPGTLGFTGSVLGIGAFYLRRRKRRFRLDETVPTTLPNRPAGRPAGFVLCRQACSTG